MSEDLFRRIDFCQQNIQPIDPKKLLLECKAEIERLREEKQEIAKRNALYVLEIAHWKAKVRQIEEAK